MNVLKKEIPERYFEIQTPEQLKALTTLELMELADSIRQDIIQSTSINGGHIGASLCCVDMIVAMHKVFTTPDDSFIFDVGHQAYAHKMLTGRRKGFAKIRKENGPSGFTNRMESEHDVFGAGHASTSISAALGILEAKRRAQKNGKVVAVIGDGALTGGLSYEGLNHTGDLKKDLIIVLNDNQMSIDPNVGALKDSFNHDPENAKNFFNLLGIDYWGPFQGHDVEKLNFIFEEAKKHTKPVVIHLLTQKGYGYPPAEEDKIRFHGCGPFALENGDAVKKENAKAKYQDLFAESMIRMADKDSSVVAITAAMPSGTSLKKFAKAHPENFYDVGIAEGHGVLFGAGLATDTTTKPFVSIYSTFLQRGYDQLIHDVALQNLPVRVCMDRAGLVGDDGATHHGIFDFAYMRSLPNFVVMAPKDEQEMQSMLETMRLYEKGPISIRFPRGEAKGLQLSDSPSPILIGQSEVCYGRQDRGDILLCAIGEPVNEAIQAAKKLEEDFALDVTVVNLRFAKPLDEKMLKSLIPNFRVVMTVEEGVAKGGVGSAVLEFMSEQGLLKPAKVLGIPDYFIEHASQAKQRAVCGIDANSIYETGIKFFNSIAYDNAERTTPRVFVGQPISNSEEITVKRRVS